VLFIDPPPDPPPYAVLHKKSVDFEPDLFEEFELELVAVAVVVLVVYILQSGARKKLVQG
jgi:hypothetical protein